MDMRKYLDLFVSESREHLDEAAEAISRLEEQPDDAELLNLLFRHGHSIKGMAASMGFDPIARVSHALEDLFDGIRKGQVPFTHEVAEKTLRAIDAISDAVDRVEKGEDPPASLAELADRLRAVGPGEDPSGGAPPPGSPAGGGGPSTPPPPRAATSSPSGSAEGLIYNAEITLAATAPMPAARAMVLYKKLESLGKILFASPHSQSLPLV